MRIINEVIELYNVFKHMALTAALEVVRWVRSWPWLHIHWFVKLSQIKMDLEAKLQELEKKLWEGF